MFKSSKLSKIQKNKTSPLYSKGRIISYDHKGTVFVYSTEEKRKIFEYNFYQKQFKKFKKELFSLVEDEFIYIADNMGFIYAISMQTNKVVWAKNFGVPFRSNIKTLNNNLYLANEDNQLYSINKKNGDTNWVFSTKITNLKSNFKNNILIDEINKNIMFLNTSGELYSVSYVNKNINWIVNLKLLSNSQENELFESLPLVANNNKLILSSGRSIAGYDLRNQNKMWQKNFTVKTKTTVTKNNVFLLTDQDFLICLDVKSGNIIWSKNIFSQIKLNFLKINSKKVGKISSLLIANSNILLFSEKGYLITFNLKNGYLISLKKITKSGIAGSPIIVDGNIYLFDKRNILLKYN